MQVFSSATRGFFGSTIDMDKRYTLWTVLRLQTTVTR